MNQNAQKNAKEFHADVSVQRLAKVYAEALLDAAEKTGEVQGVLEELDSLVDDVFRSDGRLETLFSGAAVGRQARAEAIDKVFAGRASDTFLKFVRVLNDHERLELIRPVRRAAHALFDERNRRVHVHVHSAVPVPDELRERIAQAVRQRFQKEPVLETHVDPKLLGGLKVRVGDTQFDATVRTKLNNLRNQIIARSSHEIQTGRDRFSSQ